MGYPYPTNHERMPIKDKLSSHRSYTILDVEIDDQCGAHSILSHTGCSQAPKPSIDLYRYVYI